jgi:signal transduction histidine kinase
MAQVLTEGRDRVRDLRTGTGSLTDLPAVFQQITEAAASSKGVNFKTVVEGDVRELHPMVLEELSSIGREALFCLRVRDDGRGIDPGVLEKGGREGHWGLRGMLERAGRIGAQLQLLSRPDARTEVVVTLAGKTAYRASHAKRFDS